MLNAGAGTEHETRHAERPAGVVWLVGAGPGDPELITVAGLHALRSADVVVYDRLAAPALLREAPDRALLIDAGKAPGAHTLGQDAINALLAEHAAAGRTVVRLKGGDPFLFGRGGEEALFLQERGISFRVVPGVTSAVAAPAFAGIPVTHRGVSGSVVIATGHETAGSPCDSTDWTALARAADTLVFLMGVERLAEIADRLVDAGRPAAQPAALVRWGSTPEQVVVEATLGTIAEAARDLRPPAVLVVGDVVALRGQLAWFERLPLFGARVLVTRPREQADGLAARLRAAGALPLELPAIAIHPLEDPEALDQSLRSLAEQDWAVFTSPNGVRAAFDRLDALELDGRVFAGVRLCAVGPATAQALAERGLRADLVPKRFSGDGAVLALAQAGIDRGRVAVFQADIAPPLLAEGLRAAGAEVTCVAAYRTAAEPERREELARLLGNGVDAVALTSASAVTALLTMLGDDRSRFEGVLIVTIGPSTSTAARRAGLTVDAEAEPHTIDGLVDALCIRWQGWGRRPEEAYR